MNRKIQSKLLLFTALSLLFFTVALSGCSRHSTDEGIVTTHSANGEFTQIINEHTIEMSIGEEKIKLEVPLALRKTINQLAAGDQVKVNYEGPPTIEKVYRLVYIEAYE